ncbi:hypothetical protein PGB90_007412 [Kerria lacca]
MDTIVEVTTIEETIENILMRLEEYKGTLEMIKTERIDIETIFANILTMKSNIINLAYRIDAMEMFISRVHQDMNTLEIQLIEAEQDCPDKAENTFKNLFKPIFSKISSELTEENNRNAQGMSSSTISSYEKVEIIKTDELFKIN